MAGMKKLKAKNEVSQFCPIMEIPIAVIHKIVFRLPIKAILRCRGVCKAWLDIVSEPNFCEFYARYSNSKLLLHFPNVLSSQFFNFIEFSDNGDINRIPFCLKLPDCLNRKTSVSVVGLCNGFLCLLVSTSGFWYSSRGEKKGDYKFEHICISNPIFQGCFQLPMFKRVQGDGRSVRYYFGFSRASSNFKVLRIVFGYYSVSSKIEQCDIFTVGTDRNWRSLSISIKVIFPWSKMIAAYGAFHWIPWSKHPVLISTFDLAEEKLDQISLPTNLVRDNTDIELELVLLNNQLSLVDFSDPLQISIWIMKKYPLSGSWTKLVIVRRWLPLEVHGYYIRPVAELPDGLILFSDCHRKYLISYDSKQRTSSKVDIFSYVDIWTVNVKEYSPSFFLLRPIVRV